MLSKRLEKELNAQITWEFYSKYVYLAMAAYCTEHHLDGFANFFRVQQQEEEFHALKQFDFLLDRGGRMELGAIAAPERDYTSLEKVFAVALEHEQGVTQRINRLLTLAHEENDHATVSFLQWFVDEQIEEEKTVDSYLRRLELNAGNGAGLLLLDAEAAKRVFLPPTPAA
ncbi:MAG: ferritin [Deltaproteobacteria bacterium RIFOXYA12_FULL_61_11]|nr:MAG: ferritin [Deltaproteobacteria bacterium RIFOXYA12_FULL_61_11]